ncbi:class I SAM-dependent methyltransferase [Thalassococcus sp. S3]|uniref:class I SAM-dependent methyltransferase n=1 Tax=Thalassococcus sp. S3 TaxID=2017482 RepID=UPI001024665C|nr:class I SAM-dependent methyltransferase [Thalassococcus sp. S3]QBF30543.1 hypothetical protein CFI11_04860 [Thalassococcus sp. S3]
MGFSADWLALREPADLAARDPAMLRRAAEAAGPSPIVLDLGCGTGATMRAMSSHLDQMTRWRLVDNDPDLLRRAAAEPGVQADPVEADLSDISALPLDGVGLVTASALLDLVSEDWLKALAERIEAPFYAALSYDGVMSWDPEDPNDATITAAFNAHQTMDKGFGPALGPHAVSRAAEIFADAGFSVMRAPSPWQLAPEMHFLQRMLTDGISRAAEEAGAAEAEAWGRLRHEAAPETTCWIGHEDFLATPNAAPKDAMHAPS